MVVDNNMSGETQRKAYQRTKILKITAVVGEIAQILTNILEQRREDRNKSALLISDAGL